MNINDEIREARTTGCDAAEALNAALDALRVAAREGNPEKLRGELIGARELLRSARGLTLRALRATAACTAYLTDD